jgi:hypothetical protein
MLCINVNTPHFLNGGIPSSDFGADRSIARSVRRHDLEREKQPTTPTHNTHTTHNTQQGAAHTARSSTANAEEQSAAGFATSSGALSMRAFSTALVVCLGTGVQAQGGGGGFFGGTGRAWTNDNFVACTAGPDCGPFFAEASEGSSNNK